MSHQEQVKSDSSKLFRLMSQTISLSQKIGDEAIFLTGQIRSGKSTAFNWIIDYARLVGGGNQVDPIYQIKKQYAHQGAFAQIKDSYQSVTLIPNMYEINKKEKISLVDLPGNKDKRTFVEVMMISFIFNVFFKSVKNGKFIIVMTNEGFKSKDGTQFISAISSFIRRFQCSQMSQIQLTNLFNSASLLITSVKVQEGRYNQTKDYYCQILKKNMNHLDQLKQSYKKIQDISPYMKKILESILEAKRIQLFPQAKYQCGAIQGHILQNYHRCGWKSNNLTQISKYLKFPYKEQFNQLSIDEQQTLKLILNNKIKQFENLRSIFVKFFEKYIENLKHNKIFTKKNPQIFNQLSQFYEEHEFQILENGSFVNSRIFKVNSIKTLKTILQIDRMTYQINYSQDNNREYRFDLLKMFFVSTITLLKETFATNAQEETLFFKIQRNYSKICDYLVHISEIDQQTISEFYHQLKEAIQITNLINYTIIEIKTFYYNNLDGKDVTINQYNQNQISQIIKLVQPENLDQLDMKLYFSILSRFYEFKAILSRKMPSKALESYVQSMLFTIKKKYCLQYERFIEQNKKEEPIEIKDIKSKYRTLLQAIVEVLLKLFEGNIQKLQQFLYGCSWQFYLYFFYENLVQKQINECTSPFETYKSYQKFCRKENNFAMALEICKKMMLCREVTDGDDEQQANVVMIEMQDLQRNYSRISSNQLVHTQQNITDQQYLNLMNQIIKVFFSNKRSETRDEIQDFIREHIKIKQLNIKIQNEFIVNIPNTPTPYQIFAYSNYLISLINKRKTVILLGSKSGKSTVAYWLRGEPLQKLNDRYVIGKGCKQPDRILHQFSKHTQIPNIYGYNQEISEQNEQDHKLDIQVNTGKKDYDNLLVDAPHIYSKDPQKMLAIGLMMKRLILSSAESKFILVLKQGDILKKQCSPFIELLLYYLNIFKIDNNTYQFTSVPLIIITFVDKTNRASIRQAIKKISNQFEFAQDEILQQKYKLKQSKCPNSRILVAQLLKLIFQNNLYQLFDIENRSYKQKKCLVSLFGRKGWNFQNIHQRLSLRLSTYNPSLMLKEWNVQALKEQIQAKFKLLLRLGRLLKEIFLRQILKRQCVQSGLRSTNLPEEIINVIGRESVECYQRIQNDKKMQKIQNPQYQKTIVKQQDSFPLLNSFVSLRSIINVCEGLGNYIPRVTDLKEYVNRMLISLIKGWGSRLDSLNLVRAACFKVYQLLTELQVIQQQTIENLEMENMSEKQQLLRRSYHQLFSDITIAKEYFNLSTHIECKNHLEIFANAFRVQQFDQQRKKLTDSGPSMKLYFQAMRAYKYFLGQCHNIYDEKSFKIIQTAKQHYKYFIEKSQNDKQKVIILLQESELCLLQDNIRKQLCHTNYELKNRLQFQLKSILQKISVFFVGIDEEFALRLSKQIGTGSGIINVLDRIYKKNKSNVVIFNQYYDLLIQTRYTDRAFELLELNKSNMDEETFKIYYRRINTGQAPNIQLLKEKILTIDEKKKLLDLIRKQLYNQ